MNRKCLKKGSSNETNDGKNTTDIILSLMIIFMMFIWIVPLQILMKLVQTGKRRTNCNYTIGVI